MFFGNPIQDNLSVTKLFSLACFCRLQSIGFQRREQTINDLKRRIPLEALRLKSMFYKLPDDYLSQRRETCTLYLK